MESDSYYGILGVHVNSSDDEIRRAYRKLAMQWHPDKWTRNPFLLGEAKRKFQQIQEAYSVLSDHRKRAMYDAGLYDTFEDEDEDFSDFLMEMVPLVNEVKRESNFWTRIIEDPDTLWEALQDAGKNPSRRAARRGLTLRPEPLLMRTSSTLRTRFTAWKNYRACSLKWPRVSITPMDLTPLNTNGLLPTSLPNGVMSLPCLLTPAVQRAADARPIQ